jgi:hypothetical protein
MTLTRKELSRQRIVLRHLLDSSAQGLQKTMVAMEKIEQVLGEFDHESDRLLCNNQRTDHLKKSFSRQENGVYWLLSGRKPVPVETFLIADIVKEIWRHLNRKL